MKKQDQATLSSRLEASELEKIKTIAQAEGRFTSCQARHWLRQCIRDYDDKRTVSAPKGISQG